MTQDVQDFPLLSGLQRTLAAHGVDTELRAGWLHHHPGRPAITAHLEETSNHEGAVAVVLSVSFALDDGRLLCEAFAGRGQDPRSAAVDAFDKFCSDSLHVLLAGLFDVVDESQVTVETFEHEGSKWQLIAGPFGLGRLGAKDELPIPDGLFDRLLAGVRGKDLPRSLHWFRTFRGQLDGRVLGGEALRDNDLWPQGSEALESIDWPSAPGYHSIRNFFLLRRRAHIEIRPLTDAEALEGAVDTAIRGWSGDELDDLSLYNRLVNRGVAPELAERVLAFTPIAFSSYVLASANVPENYLISVEGVPQGPPQRLIDEPVFALAQHRARRASDDLLRSIAGRCSLMGVVQELASERGGELSVDDVARLQFTEPVIARPRFRP